MLSMETPKYNHKILIVEDEEVMVKTLTDNLIAAGFANILKAKNGAEGLEIALRETPDLVLLDIVMPVMDGMTMLEKLRAEAKGKKMKVIFLTNLTVDDSIMTGIMANSPSYYVVKAEYSIDDVISKVRVTLGIDPILPNA